MIMKRKNIHITYLIVFLLSLTVGTIAQNPTFSFENITTKDGLSSLKVSSVVQDEKGFIWLGTMNGLNRYDGYQFKVYRHNQNDPNSIPISRIVEIYIVNKELFWLTTKNEGIIKFNPITEKFTHFKHDPDNPESLPFNDIWEFYQDKDSVLWGTFDLRNGFYITKDNRFVKSPMPKEYLKSKQLRMKLTTRFIEDFKLDVDAKRLRIQQADNGDYWVGLIYGDLYYYSPRTDKIIKVTNGPLKKTTAITAILQDRTKITWISKLNDGVLKYNPLKRSFRRYNKLTADNHEIDHLYIRSIFQDEQNKIWLGTNLTGLIVFDPKSNAFQHYKSTPTDPKSLPNNKVRCIFIDKKDKMWIGTVGFLSEYNTKNKNFINYPIYDEDSAQYHARVYSIAEDDKENFWIANWDNMVRFNKQDRSFKYFSKSLFNMDNIRHILIDDTGLLWISAEYGGTVVFDPRTEEIVRTYTEANGLSNNGVFQVYQESKNIFWVATFNGLNRIDISENKIKTYNMDDGLPTNIVMGIIKDKKQNFWLPTAAGLVQFSQKNNEFHTFYESDGLQHNEFVEGAHFLNTTSQEILVGGIKGFNIFHPDSIKTDKNPPPVSITSLKILNNEIKPGKPFNDRIILTKPIEYTDEITLYYSDRVFSFEFSALHYNKQDRNQYAYKMEGFDKDFIYTDASRRYATYTNLPSGEYIFKVIASNNYGIWNKEGTTIKVTIVPPFWQTGMFRFFVISSIVLLLFAFYKIRINIEKKQKKELEVNVQERTYELQEINKELEEKKEEVEIQKEEIETQKEMLVAQNTELEEHKNNLESLVLRRTSELVISKEKAEESDKLKTAFLENMSHEIRTPMNAIIGFSSLLGDDKMPKENKSQYLEIIQVNGEALLSIIDGIIDLSKIHSGITPLEKKNFQLNSLLEEVHLYFSETIDIQNNPDIDFIYHPLQKQIEITSDFLRAKQIINNLLSNAFKYTAKGAVELGCRIADDNMLHIYVKDTGIGISEKDQEIIFDRFSKVETDNTKLYSGVGLGLSISKPLAKVLGGDITVKSELGKGSEFTFILPYTNDASSSSTDSLEEKYDAKSINWHDKSILIVEDENDNYYYLYTILKKTQLNLLRATNGVEAVDICSNNEHINLVLMDIKLPKMNGYEALKRIRAFRQKLPVIAQTAYAQSEDIEKMEKAKFDDILTKPIAKNMLLQKLSIYLK